MLSVFTLGLFPALAAGQADLIVTPVSFPTQAGPGEEVLVSFIVQNIGTSPTALTAIMNYIFVLGQAGETLAQLSPTDSVVAHTWGSLAPGQMDNVGPFPIVIPPDAPLDQLLLIAVYTDWGNLEAESNESNNQFVWSVNIVGRSIGLPAAGICLTDEVDLPDYSDYFIFDGIAGAPIWAEVIAERMGSTLDPKLHLLMLPDSLLATEGYTPSLGLDSRLGYPSLPASIPFRLEVMGENSTTGMYDLCLQRALPEAEPNDGMGTANPMPMGGVIAAELGWPGDMDYYSFAGTVGDVLILDIDSDETLETPPGSTFDPLAIVYDAVGDTILLDDDTDGYDPYFFFVIPSTGTYYIGLTSSPGGGLGGGYPGYNYMFKLSQLTGASLPDLSPAGIVSLPPSVPAGDTVAVDFQTWNTGGLATFAGGVSVDVWLSTDPVIDPLDSLLCVGDFEGDVSAGSFVPTSVSVPIPISTLPGDYYIGVVLDPTNNEVESNEGNNSGVVAITIQTPTGIGDRRELPRSFALLQNYPNPVSGETHIAYDVPASADGSPSSMHVKIEIFNVLGQRLSTLVDEETPSGSYTAIWDGRLSGRPVSAGIYFYRMTAGSFVETRRMVIIR